MGVPLENQLPWVTYDENGIAVMPTVESPDLTWKDLFTFGLSSSTDPNDINHGPQDIGAYLLIAVGLFFLFLRWD